MSTSKQRENSQQPGASSNRASASRSHGGTELHPAAAPATSPSSQPDPAPAGNAAFRRLHALVIEALEDMKARDVHQIDVRGRSDVTDMLVVASGTSSRHVRSIADEVVSAGKEAGLPPIGVEGQDGGDWVLVDMGDIVVHVMQPQSREFYGLERLWGVGGEDRDDARASH